MTKKDFLQQKYCEINQLKNLLQTYPKEYCETIIKVMEKVFDEITEYLEEEKNKVKTIAKKIQPQRVFTVEELAKYNGKNGAKAYVAVGGIIYDVTAISKWSGGNHYGITAGKVLDKEFAQCHSNKLAIMEYAAAVGVLDNINKDSSANIKTDSNSRDELRYYKIEDIAKFDGKNGTLAYVVVNGTVYDVTSMNQWINGSHYGLSAGKDLTEYFKTCHKNENDILKKLRIVGAIIE
ncbi:cytochrome b5 domain-containing protein [Clostridium sp. D53t1_180928_C8]|uniref:cytochrome b5 domain-containing protein n=1 Tax=Clostridium sp. D53t1_180928_C8 TaxID=2787101 RepID=UPI0018AB2D36|nr:cytochrome b5 domain-containing protein [Clostridium sp. D53t1_180928_C8]